MPSPQALSEKLLLPMNEHPPADDIETLNHHRALLRQRETTRPEKLHYVPENSHEFLSHW